MKQLIIKYNECYSEDYGNGMGFGCVGTKTITLSEEKLADYIVKENNYNDSYEVDILDIKIAEV